MADTSVKIFHSGQPGAPVLNTDKGSLIALLDAVLVSGFGLRAVDALSVVNGVATAQISAGHSAVKDATVLVAGADTAALNGEKRVLSTTASTVKFDTTGIDPQVATGAITLKVAPLGWEKPFAAGSLAVYRMLDPNSTRSCLRVNDDYTRVAAVCGYDVMTDVSTGEVSFPNVNVPGQSVDAQGLRWYKSYAPAARPWVVIGDARGFYFCSSPGRNESLYAIFGFGDIASNAPNDAYRCAINGSDYDRLDDAGDFPFCLAYHANGPGYIRGAATGLGGARPISKWGSLMTGGAGYSGGPASGSIAFPNAADAGLLLSPVFVFQDNGLRGAYRGLMYCQQVVRDVFSTRDRLVATDGPLAGRSLMAVKAGMQYYAGYSGVVFFDVTGPWS